MEQPVNQAHDPPPANIGSLRVLCELGKGSMATVYLARAQGPGGFERLFALKMIHSHLSEQKEFVDLFLNEARIAARIHHPNVIAVHDIDVHDGRTYLKMDYASGETLAQALDRTWNQGHPFPLDLAAQIVAGVADGLHAAHELRDSIGAPLEVIHRDVGPHNILIGYDGVVRVMDFGIAKALDRVSGTSPGVWRGTAAFMSPEQVRGEALDRRADLFSLGVVLWETIVGARLFRHRTMAGTMNRILTMEVPKPSSMRAEIPPALERIVMKALERDRDKRYASAQEMGDDLRQFLVGIGVAPATSRVERFMRELFMERHQARSAMEREATRQHLSGEMRAILSPASPVEVKLLITGKIAVDPADPNSADQTLDAPVEVTTRAPVTAEPRDALLGLAATPSEQMVQQVTAVTARTDALPLVVPPAGEPIPAYKGEPRAASRRPTDKPTPSNSTERVVMISMLVIIAGLSLAVLSRLINKPHEVAPTPEAPLAMVTLSFELDPADAQLNIDGEKHDGDLIVPLSPREYSVEVSAEGYKKRALTVSAEATRTIQVRLEPLGPDRPPNPNARSRLRGRRHPRSPR